MAEKLQERLPSQNIQRARFYLLCVLLALLAAAGALLLGANYWQKRIGLLKNMLPPNVDMRLGGLTLNEADEEGRTLFIEADTALYNQAGDFFTLEEVRAQVGRSADVYDITARRGRYDQAAGIITLTEEVKVVETGGGILLTDHLVLKPEEGLLSSESPFCYADPETELEGSAFVYHTRERRLFVEGPVRLLF